MDFFDTYGSYTVNGQILPVYESSGLFPSAAPAPYYMGRGSTPPTLSLGAGGGVAAGGIGLDSEVEASVSNPFSLVDSPLLWSVGFLVIGLLWLRHVHWA